MIENDCFSKNEPNVDNKRSVVYNNTTIIIVPKILLVKQGEANFYENVGITFGY